MTGKLTKEEEGATQAQIERLKGLRTTAGDVFPPLPQERPPKQASLPYGRKTWRPWSTCRQQMQTFSAASRAAWIVRPLPAFSKGRHVSKPPRS